MSSKNERQRLADIVENIDAIDDYVTGMSFDTFAKDRKTVDATERCLERIIEAIAKIGPDRMALVLDSLPAQAVRSMGNRLRHEYDQIDLATVWISVTDDLPPLRAACVTALGA